MIFLNTISDIRKKFHLKTLFFSVIALFVMSCNKEEFKPFDQSFIHIHHQNNDVIRVQDNRLEEVDYKVYLSSKLTYEPTEVKFEITHGDGLELGRDYEVLTPERTLVFPAGVFELPIRIKWLRNTVDLTKNNTVKITLVSNNRNYIIGLPGPDKKQSSLEITKYH